MSQLAADASTRMYGNEGRPTSFWVLALGSIGVVYGDIGTSPLYAIKKSLTAAGGSAALAPDMIFGVLSLMLWTLIVIVTLKYVVVMLQADNNGEGGTLSLMALAQRAVGERTSVVALLGMAGAALFYGDAMITPAISVLSAVEGLTLVTPAFERYVLPIQPHDLGRIVRNPRSWDCPHCRLVWSDYCRLVRRVGHRWFDKHRPAA